MIVIIASFLPGCVAAIADETCRSKYMEKLSVMKNIDPYKLSF